MPGSLAHRSNGGVETHVEATGDGRLFLHTRQDAEPILDLNKQTETGGRSAWGADQEMWKVASIPHVVVVKWLNDYGVNFYNNDHWPKVRQLLNSPDWRWLRTGGGRL